MPTTAPKALHFTESDEANALIATDPFALLIGFVLDQQVTVQKAFVGPLVLQERLGGMLTADAVADADLETIFREKPALHRYPGVMATRVAMAPGFISRASGSAPGNFQVASGLDPCPDT